MRKLYAFFIAMVALGVISSEVAKAQTYAITDYVVRKIDAPDAAGLGSGADWVEITDTHVLDGYLHYFQGVLFEVCALGKQIPFNFRFLNQQITTSNTFSITDNGGVVLDPAWGASWAYYPYSNYDYCNLYIYGLNNASNYCYDYNYGWYQSFYNGGSY